METIFLSHFHPQNSKKKIKFNCGQDLTRIPNPTKHCALGNAQIPWSTQILVKIDCKSPASASLNNLIRFCLTVMHIKTMPIVIRSRARVRPHIYLVEPVASPMTVLKPCVGIEPAKYSDRRQFSKALENGISRWTFK